MENKETRKSQSEQPSSLFMAHQQLSKTLVSSSEDEKVEAYKSLDALMRRWLTSENTIILTGSGSSIGEDVSGGKTMVTLWLSVKEKVGESEFSKILKSVNYSGEDLEELISRLLIKKAGLTNDKKDTDAKALGNYVAQIKEVIRSECTFNITAVKGFQHPIFLQKLLNSRKKTAPRVKIFTLNYDTIFEQAGRLTNTIVIDGFSFTQNEFSGINFDLDIVKRDRSRIHNEENFYSNVLHLYKLHGSVDWEDDVSHEKIIKKPDTKSPLLIYPNSQKYEESYAMPFFEMISRLQMELRKQNVCLLIVGYSFGDTHINRIIEEAINSNFNLELIVVSPSISNELDPKNKDNEYIQGLYKKIKGGNNNITLIADTFANFTINLPTPQFEQAERVQGGVNEDKSI